MTIGFYYILARKKRYHYYKYDCDGDVDSDDCDVDEPLDEADEGPDQNEEAVDVSLAKHRDDLFATAIQKVDAVSKKIAGSHSRRQEFKGLCKAAGLNHRTPIAGYGIRWNVIYDSRTRMCAAQEIVNKMLLNDRKGSQYFKGTIIHTEEWEAIESLNSILEIFSTGTKRMEGDFPSGAMVLPEYNRMKKSLNDIQKKTSYLALTELIEVMQNQFDQYINKALECDALVIATIIHPRYRLAFFNKVYPEHSERASNLIKEAFASQLAQQPPAPSEDPQVDVEDDDDFNDFTARPNGNTQTAREAELESYLMGQREFDKNKTIDDWWRVNHLFFPVLALVARDYLAVSGTTCSAERVFSSSADVCLQDRGALLPTTISRSVSTREWVRSEIKVGGEYGEAMKCIKYFQEQSESKKKKRVTIEIKD